MLRVTAIFFAQDGDSNISEVLDALAGQTRKPDTVLVLTDKQAKLTPADIKKANITQVTSEKPLILGADLTRILQQSPPGKSVTQPEKQEWFWLLRAGTIPTPNALTELLAAVEVMPSVAMAGPKLVDRKDHTLIHSFGQTLTPLGARVEIVRDELDQSQHDNEPDVLAVALEGALVRRTVWEQLGGTDPRLARVDAGLDLGIRIRLAGYRVIRVPNARVSVAKRTYPSIRQIRTAELHRRFVYAPLVLLPLHWLSLLPLALLRCIGFLLAKKPGAVGGEIISALRATIDPSVFRARYRLSRTTKVPWRGIRALRMSGATLREHRDQQREKNDTRNIEPELVRAPFFSGGFTVIALMFALNLMLFWRLIGANQLSGGALLPLSSNIGELWGKIGWGYRDIGLGFLGAADPANLLWALLGSLTWWNPSLSVVLLWLTALPLAALGAWWLATRFSSRNFPPVLAAALWSLAPPLLAALNEGRIGAVLAHLLLPWLFLSLIEGSRSLAAASTAALLFAGVCAASPSLAPTLIVVTLLWAFVHPRALLRLIGVPIPALGLFLPLVIDAFRAGIPFAPLADPGVPMAFSPNSVQGLLLGWPGAEPSWSSLLEGFGLPGLEIMPIILFIPLALLALLSPFLPGARRSIPALLLATFGLATAYLGQQIQVAGVGMEQLSPWPGAALSLYYLGLIFAATLTLQMAPRLALVTGTVVALGAGLAVIPLAIAPLSGNIAPAPGTGRTLPTLVAAEEDTNPRLGTVRIVPGADGSLTVRLERGQGTMLDDQSALFAGRATLNDNDVALARLAANLASRSSYNPAALAAVMGISFVFLEAASPNATPEELAVRERAITALDASESVSGQSDGDEGTLWAFTEAGTAPQPKIDQEYRRLVLVAQGTILLLALLLALPTIRRRRVVHIRTLDEKTALIDFSEVDDE